MMIIDVSYEMRGRPKGGRFTSRVPHGQSFGKMSTRRGAPVRLRIRLESLMVETFSVVLGVLLALGVNSWREG